MKTRLLFFSMVLSGTLLLSCGNKEMNKESSEKTTITEENAILSAINNRKSVRSFIKDKAVPSEDIEAILRAGMAAPSGKDIRPWEFIVINDRSVLDAMAGELKNAGMLEEAPMAIVVCGDSIKSFYWYLDCAAATENILLAAEAVGLGAVWTAAYPYEDRMEVVTRYLELPSNILPLVVVPMGYPSGENSPKDKFDESRIHYEVW